MNPVDQLRKWVEVAREKGDEFAIMRVSDMEELLVYLDDQAHSPERLRDEGMNL